jgi:hypothetical protein
MLDDESRSLRALSIALEQLQDPPDEQTQEKINQAVKDLRLAVRACSPLLEIYNEALDQLQDATESQPRNKVIPLSRELAPEEALSELTYSKLHKRKPGLHLGAFIISDDFDEPLPDSFWLGEA